MIPETFATDGVVNLRIFPPTLYGVWSTQRGYIVWDKPQGASWIYIINQQAGGGGGGGFSGAAGTARGGGGGGGSGSIQRMLMPAAFVFDGLYLQVTPGGNGGAAGADATAANRNNVTVSAGGTSHNWNMLTYLGDPGGAGGAGSATAGGTGGIAGSIGQAPGMLATSSLLTSIAGQAGAAGGAHTGAVGGSITLPTTFATTGGAGGAGTPTANTNFAGGSIPAGGPWPAIAGGLAAGGAGLPGFGVGQRIDILRQRLAPLFTSGGTGGGSNGASGVGGAGAKGGWGSGGGGGGGGVTGGAGGDGGDGYVAIMWW